MVSLQKVYSGNALTRQVKRASQDLLRVRKNNATRLALISGVGFAFANLISSERHPLYTASMLAGSILGPVIYHYGVNNTDRENAKACAKELKRLKATDEYQNILARAKSIKSAN